MSKPLLTILFITIVLRLISLNQSLWLDEAISANVAKNYSYSQIVTVFSPHDFHSPLYYLTLKSWCSVFGYSEFGLRSLSVLFSLFTVILVYKCFGFWPSLLLSLNPLFVYYSQEARMYSMVTLFVFCAFLSFRKNKIFLYYLFTLLSLFTFYGSIFFFASVSLYFLIKKDYKKFTIYTLAPVLGLLLLSPLLSVQLKNSQEMLSQVSNWSLVLGKLNLKNLLLIPIKFTSGRISFFPKIIYYIISGSFALFVFSKLIKKNIYSFMFWSTLLIGILFSVFTPMLQYFRFLYILPFMCLIIDKNKVIGLFFLFFSILYLSNSSFHREDWKSLSATLQNNVYMIDSFADPIKYYSTAIISDIRGPIIENNITVIPYGEAIHGFDHNTYLTNLGYKKISTQNFREIIRENWSK